jgi:ketosteroid isomerase-like protein
VTLSVADQLAILDVITRTDQAATNRDVDAYVDLFSEDAVLDGAQGYYAGRAALRAAVGLVWTAEDSASLHLTLNPVVEQLDGDDEPSATARSILLIADPARPVSILTAAAITQTLRRRDGQWRITRRTVAAAAGQNPLPSIPKAG